MNLVSRQTPLQTIEILTFPSVQLLDVTGPLQVFATGPPGQMGIEALNTRAASCAPFDRLACSACFLLEKYRHQYPFTSARQRENKSVANVHVSDSP